MSPWIYMTQRIKLESVNKFIILSRLHVLNMIHYENKIYKQLKRGKRTYEN